VTIVTGAVRLAAALAIACVLVSSSQAAPPHYVQHFVAFVTIYGQGTVRSVPTGIDCPKVCRARYLENSHLKLEATPAKGWRFVRFGGYCHGTKRACGFDLVSPHDCFGPLCPIGAFGTRAYFVRSQ